MGYNPRNANRIPELADFYLASLAVVCCCFVLHLDLSEEEVSECVCEEILRKTMNTNRNNNTTPNGRKKQTPWINRYKLGPSKPCLVDSTQPRINLQDDETGRCPYRAWKNYFPTEEFVPLSNTVSMIRVFELYMVRYFDLVDMSLVMNDCSVSVDYKDLNANEHVQKTYSDFHETLHNNPENIIACLGIAAHQTVLKHHTSQQQQLQSSEQIDIPVIRARIHNYEPLTTLKHLKAKNFGKFISIRGTIVKVSNVRPLCTTMAFKCSECGKLQALLLLDHNYVVPNSCSGGCNGKIFQPLYDHPLTEIRDWQTVKIQEMLSDTHREAGRMPRNVEVELTHDLADSASPGDVVTVTGVVKIKKAEENGYFSKKGRDKCLHLLYIEGNNVTNMRRIKARDCRDGNPDVELEFSERDLMGIDEIRKQDDLFSLMVCSLCPTIYGQEMVKAGIMLSLFGGSNRGGQEENSDRVATRGDSHVLVVGDPGLGKSQILRAASRLAPRAVYVCGNTSTGSGLTVTLSRDSNGDMALEAGALVLADQGVCCIDEFDKMTGQQQALLEAMEQQCISIAKAGVVCSLPARCSIVAAANPIGGHYNKAKTVSENLHMGSALLSRFDLVFILLDTPDEEKDRMLSDYVMSIHTGKNTSPSTSFGDLEQPATGQGSKMSSLERHLSKYARRKACDPIPHSLAWKYIAYARKHCPDVTMTKEACQVLKEFYLTLRKQGYNGDSTPITTRQLESLKRLSEARAKVEMRPEVTASDARDVVDLMKHSMQDTFSDEDNLLVYTRAVHGSGVSKHGAVKKLVTALHKAAQNRSNSVFSLDDLRVMGNGLHITTNLMDVIDSLNNQGYLIKKASNLYQLQTMN